MASLNSHRKLANSNSNSNSTTTPDTTDTTVQTCLQFCDSDKNTTSSLYSGFCPQVCLAICPSLCTYPLTNLPLPEDYNPSDLKKSHNLSPLLISMLILLATTFLLIIFYVIYTKLYFHFYAPHNNSFRPRSRRGGRVGSDSLHEEHGSRVVFNPFWCIPTVGLPATVINSIAVHKYGKEMEERDCAVCLAEFKEGEELRILPKCNHAFHVPCIDTWLSSHTNCPLCRAPIIPSDQQNHDHDHGHDHDKAEDTSAALPTVEEATEDNSSSEVLRISIVSGEEGVDGNNLEESMENSASNKDQENLEEISKGSCSQRWSLERGAANLVTRSLSCSGKIFSSRSNTRPSPNS